ncbi:hypothetical protein NE865_11446 [Phthorimaea operculella]|nr:hypothetical protein NE865_11446 [Phthorimaea operculella]
MESIRNGSKTLRKVDVEKKPVVEDSRSNLLSEIRQGIELKSVPKNTNANEKPPRATASSGLADALKRALDERSRAIHSDSDEDDDDETTSEGEWD